MSLYVPDPGMNHALAITTDKIEHLMPELIDNYSLNSFSLTNKTNLNPKLDYWERLFITTDNFYNKHKDLFIELKNMDKNLIVINKENKINKLISYTGRDLDYWYSWKRKVNKGEPYYECSSKGDKRFSPFYARVSNKSIEEWYQVDIKGYSTIKDGKGKSPKKKMDKEDIYYEYLKLWSRYFLENEELLNIIKKKAKGKPITDMFAISEVNQARAICDICNYGLFK